jgi:excisionase family DNA binding protein
MPRKADHAELLTTTAAAARLKCSRRTMLDMAKAGEIPGAVRLGRDWLIPASALAGVVIRKAGRPPKEKAG